MPATSPPDLTVIQGYPADAAGQSLKDSFDREFRELVSLMPSLARIPFNAIRSNSFRCMTRWLLIQCHASPTHLGLTDHHGRISGVPIKIVAGAIGRFARRAVALEVVVLSCASASASAPHRELGIPTSSSGRPSSKPRPRSSSPPSSSLCTNGGDAAFKFAAPSPPAATSTWTRRAPRQRHRGLAAFGEQLQTATVLHKCPASPLITVVAVLDDDTHELRLPAGAKVEMLWGDLKEGRRRASRRS